MSLIKICRFFEKQYSLLVLIALILGLLFPNTAKNLDVLIVPLMILIVFLGSLKMKLNKIQNDLKSLPSIGLITLLRMIFLPTLFYLILSKIFPQYSLGILMILIVPIAVAASAVTSIFGGNIFRSMILTILSSVISIISVPYFIYFFEAKTIQLDSIALMKTIATILVLPIIASFLIQKTKPQIIEKTKEYYSGISVIIFFIMIWILIAISREEIINNIKQSFSILLIHLLIMGLYLFSAYFLSLNDTLANKKSIFISFIFCNNVLAISLSALYFDPKTTFFLSISEIAWSLAIPIWKKLEPVFIKE